MVRGKKTKFVFVTGGVVSSLGKGLAAASMGALLENRGLEVTHLKLDPYINVDPGTMSPFQHGEVYVTDDGAETGTDRVAMAARVMLPRPTMVVNLQGDEPLIEPAAIEALVHAMDEGGPEMATMARPLVAGEWERPEVVKVVTDLSGNALYFSRAPIPARREPGPSPLARAHVGMYAYTPAFLERFAALEPGRLEREERLEQLRALEHGFRIRVVDTTYSGFGVDTEQDLVRARALVAAGR